MWNAWERTKNCTRFWWKRDLLEYRDVDRSMGSEWILGRLAGITLSGFNWLRIGAVADCCECGDEPSDSGATELFSMLTTVS
jgi:hypothetical protein